jgi:hypothetical protein
MLIVFEEQAQIQISIKAQGAHSDGTQALLSSLEPVWHYINKIKEMQTEAKTTYESVRTPISISYLKIAKLL